MRRLIVLSCLLTLCFGGLVGCGKEEEPNGTRPTTRPSRLQKPT